MKLLISILFVAFFISFGFTRCQKTVTDVVTDTVTKTVVDTLSVHDSLTRTITLQPGLDDGQDCLVSDLPIYNWINLSHNPDIVGSEWTYAAQGYGDGAVRTYIEFTALDALADSSVKIRSAKLYLYGLDPGTGVASPEGNSVYPGSPYSAYTDNSCWLKRVTGNWNDDSLIWNTMPLTTDLNETTVPSSTSQWNNNDTVDITNLVQDMVNAKKNYGFCLQQKSEQIYRSLNFAGSRNPDPGKWPKLIVSYAIY